MTTIGPSSFSYFPLWKELVMPGKRLTALHPPNLLPKWRAELKDGALLPPLESSDHPQLEIRLCPPRTSF